MIKLRAQAALLYLALHEAVRVRVVASRAGEAAQESGRQLGVVFVVACVMCGTVALSAPPPSRGRGSTWLVLSRYAIVHAVQL